MKFPTNTRDRKICVPTGAPKSLANSGDNTTDRIVGATKPQIQQTGLPRSLALKVFLIQSTESNTVALA